MENELNLQMKEWWLTKSSETYGWMNMIVTWMISLSRQLQCWMLMLVYVGDGCKTKIIKKKKK